MAKAIGIFSVVYFGLLLVSLRAQQPPVQQFESTQRAIQMQKPQLLNLSTNAEAPELYPGENVDVGPQRILKVKPRKTWFEVTADSQYFYTGNAYLTDSNRKSTALFVNTIQAAFAPEPFELGSGQFGPAIGFRSQWFNYGLDGQINSLGRLDFDAQTAFANASYQIGYWRFLGEFDFTRLLSQAHYNEVYREYVPELAVQRLFPIKDSLLFIAGYQFDYHFTEIPTMPPPGWEGATANDRMDNSLSLSLAWQPVPKLVLQPYYRLEDTYYPHYSDNTTPEKERNDVINDVGASLFYHFTKNFEARVFVDYEVLNSDYHSLGPGVSFHNLDAGAGLTLDFRF